MKRFKQERIQQIRSAKSTNPKEFWKIIISTDKKKDTVASLDDFFAYFKEENSNQSNENADTLENDFNLENLPNLNQQIKLPITPDEILKAIKALKNNKSHGVDKIKNEHIKYTSHVMIPTYVKLFNIIFDKGIIPESWALGDILPIYKNNGDANLPENYRPITLLSCLGKLFTLVINNMLKAYAEEYNLINSCQAGFRKGYSTTDNLFIIQNLIDILKASKNKLFCAFIDLRQAFDTVWRGGLWTKLLRHDIDGKCFTLIRNMYCSIKSRIKISEGTSAYFPCCTEVRQGENLSPFLFSIYMNDLEDYFRRNKASGIACESDDDKITVFFKIFILLYADDTVLFGKTKDDLQQSLNIFENYCEEWKLTVNISKTKVLIFSGGRYSKNSNFYFKNVKLDLVSEYKYLGIYLSKSGSF